MVNSTNFFSNVNGSSTNMFGLSSGINSQEIINALVLARRAPAVQLEKSITQNNAKLSAYAELKGLVANFSTSLTTMRGDQSYFAESAFDKKLSFTNSRAITGAPVGYNPPQAGNILGTSVTDKAQPGKYSVQVQQLAQSHQVRTDVVSSRTTALVDLGYTAGPIEINGKTITLDADDTLMDLRDKINASGAGVQASILSASGSEHFLVLNGKETGSANVIDFNGGGGAADALGFTAAGAIKNEVQAAADAIIRVNGIDVDIVRSTNTISDVIEGVTLNLFAADPNAEIVIDVESDYNAVKTNIVDFVEAYNALRDFIDDQRVEKARTEGGAKEYGALAFDSALRTLSGQLNSLIGIPVAGQQDGYQTLGQVGIKLNNNYRLEIDDQVFDNRLLENLDQMRSLFEFSVTTNDPAIRVSNIPPNAVANLDGNGNPVPYYINIGGVDENGNVISANFHTDAGAGAGGAYDGTASVSGRVITVTNGPNAGLSFIYGGAENTGPVDGLEVTFSRGLADQFFYIMENAYSLDNGTGTIASSEEALTRQNETFTSRITDIDSRIELYRERLMMQFAQMEAAVAKANSLKQSLQSMFDAGNKKD